MGRRKSMKTTTKRGKAGAVVDLTEPEVARSSLLRLPPELLDLILPRLDLLDHVRLGAVCRQLHSHCILHNPPLSRSLCLVPTTRPNFLLRSFLEPLRRHRRKSSSWDHLQCVGYHEGWLVVLEGLPGLREMHLYHRFLGSRIPLPRLRCDYVWKVVLSADPTRDDYVVAAMYGRELLVSHMKRGGGGFWMEVDVPAKVGEDYPPIFSDVAFYENQLWLLLADQSVVGWRFETDCSFALARLPVSFLTTGPSLRSFLVKSGGRLLAAVWGGRGKFFRVFECRDDARFYERSDLGGRALLLKYPSSREILSANISVGVEEMGTLDRDCVYATLLRYATFVYRHCPRASAFAPVKKLMHSGAMGRDKEAGLSIEDECFPPLKKKRRKAPSSRKRRRNASPRL